MTRTKTNTWRSTKQAKQQDVTDIKNKMVLFVISFYFCIIICIN